jgi:hypothetical protein
MGTCTRLPTSETGIANIAVRVLTTIASILSGVLTLSANVLMLVAKCSPRKHVKTEVFEHSGGRAGGPSVESAGVLIRFNPFSLEARKNFVHEGFPASGSTADRAF